jgi:hypothetical protein
MAAPVLLLLVVVDVVLVAHWLQVRDRARLIDLEGTRERCTNFLASIVTRAVQSGRLVENLSCGTST